MAYLWHYRPNEQQLPQFPARVMRRLLSLGDWTAITSDPIQSFSQAKYALDGLPGGTRGKSAYKIFNNTSLSRPPTHTERTLSKEPNQFSWGEKQLKDPHGIEQHMVVAAVSGLQRAQTTTTTLLNDTENLIITINCQSWNDDAWKLRERTHIALIGIGHKSESLAEATHSSIPVDYGK